MPLEFIAGAVIGAAAASKTIRNAVRWGAIYGVGGALAAYDRISTAAHELARNARKATVAAARTPPGDATSKDAAPTSNGSTTAPSEAPAATPSS
jgi:hypothetical protein